MASTSTWCGGYFLWPWRSVFWSLWMESNAMGWRRVRKNSVSSFMSAWLQTNSPLASHISSQPRSSLSLFLLSVSCFMIWQNTSSRRISCTKKTHFYFYYVIIFGLKYYFYLCNNQLAQSVSKYNTRSYTPNVSWAIRPTYWSTYRYMQTICWIWHSCKNF